MMQFMPWFRKPIPFSSTILWSFEKDGWEHSLLHAHFENNCIFVFLIQCCLPTTNVFLLFKLKCHVRFTYFSPQSWKSNLFLVKSSYTSSSVSPPTPQHFARFQELNMILFCEIDIEIQNSNFQFFSLQNSKHSPHVCILFRTNEMPRNLLNIK